MAGEVKAQVMWPIALLDWPKFSTLKFAWQLRASQSAAADPVSCDLQSKAGVGAVGKILQTMAAVTGKITIDLAIYSVVVRLNFLNFLCL